MSRVLMTLVEALEIKRAIKNKADIQKAAGAKFVRLHNAEINFLAGFTEAYCKSMTKVGVPSFEMTVKNVSDMEFMYCQEWLQTRKHIGDQNEPWMKMIQCQKILENWKEKYEWDATVDVDSSDDSNTDKD